MANSLNFVVDLLKSRSLIWDLAKKDARSRYMGSFLGILWSFINPIISILIYWVVFQIGFKSLPVSDFPFVLWLLTGMIPWLFLSESVSSATHSIVENSYLVKKVVFRVSILPIIKIVSSIFVHLFFILLLFLIFLMYGYKFSIYHLQILYYLFATVFFVLSISWITSSLNVFLKDVGQIVGMIINFLFWLTPIFWNMNIVSEQYRIYFKINPVYYLVEGYRNTFIYHRWFWEDLGLTFYFWGISFFFLLIGIKLFKRLRPHFADVL